MIALSKSLDMLYNKLYDPLWVVSFELRSK
jgi:hypothetical protein